MNVRLISPAEEEYADSMLFYLKESPRAADAFIEEIENALAEIGQAPKRYPIYEDDIRVKVFTTFPFSLFYRVRNNEVLVVSVSHTSRKPRHWYERH